MNESTRHQQEIVDVLGAAVMVVATMDDASVSRAWLQRMAEAVEEFAPGLATRTRDKLSQAAYDLGADD